MAVGLVVVVIVVALLPALVAYRYTSPVQRGDFVTHPWRGWSFVAAALRVPSDSELKTSGEALRKADWIFKRTAIDPVEVQLLFVTADEPYHFTQELGGASVDAEVTPSYRFIWEVRGTAPGAAGSTAQPERVVVALLDYETGRLLYDIRNDLPAAAPQAPDMPTPVPYRESVKAAELLGDRRGPLMRAMAVAAGSRLFILLVGLAAAALIGITDPDWAWRFPAGAETFKGFLGSLLNPWAHWDGVWYIKIARAGYADADGSTAFFPLYPALLRYAGFLFDGNLVVTGIALSLLCFAGSAWLLFKLVARDFDDQTAPRAVVYLSLFPTSFFLQAVYTESLFLLLSLACFFWAREGRWRLSGLAALLAVLTRSTGVLLVIPMAVSYFQSRGWRLRRADANVANLLMVAEGLLIWMAYLSLSFGKPFLFAEAQDQWRRSMMLPNFSIGRAARGGRAGRAPAALGPVPRPLLARLAAGRRVLGGRGQPDRTRLPGRVGRLPRLRPASPAAGLLAVRGRVRGVPALLPGDVCAAALVPATRPHRVPDLRGGRAVHPRPAARAPRDRGRDGRRAGRAHGALRVVRVGRVKAGAGEPPQRPSGASTSLNM